MGENVQHIVLPPIDLTHIDFSNNLELNINDLNEIREK